MPRRKPSPTLPQEVFLSHSNRDRSFAQELAATVRQHGVPLWYSETNILGAQQWHDEIGKALKRCDWFLLILSPSSLKSMWVKRELDFALQDKRYFGRIIPVIRRRCDSARLSWTLSSNEPSTFLLADQQLRLILVSRPHPDSTTHSP